MMFFYGDVGDDVNTGDKNMILMTVMMIMLMTTM